MPGEGPNPVAAPPHLQPQEGRTKAKVLLGLLGVLMLVAGHFECIAAGGTVHTLWPPGKGAYLSFDGKPVEVRSTLRHQLYEARSGPNFVRVIGETPSGLSGVIAEYSLDIREGFDELLLPVDQEQCFLRFEAADGAGRGGPRFRLIGRHADHAPLDVSGVRYFGVEALPSGRDPKPGAVLVEHVACADVSRSEADLVVMLRL